MHPIVMAAMLRFRPGLVVALLAVIGLLGACGILGSKKPPPPCPKIVILKDAGKVTKFRPGAGRDLSDLLYEARLHEIATKCKYNRKKREVQVDMHLTIVARRGPAGETRHAKMQYFIAIMDPERNILAKEVFDADLVFPVNVDKGSITESLDQVIPFSAYYPDASKYVILGGFQIGSGELDLNRKKRRLNLPGRLPEGAMAPGASHPDGQYPR